jgi:serine/threonine-protein kinase
MSSILRDAPSPVDGIRSDVSRGLAQTVERCLEKAPAERFQTAHELSEELDRLSREPPAGESSISVSSVFPEPTQPESHRSIAVLPFLNRSGNPEDEYFSDGLSEELINALGKLPAIRVTARGSAFQFRGQELDVREVGRKLGVDAVLEGSVRIAGNRLRITTELASCRDGLQLWSERFDGEMRDVFETQDQIARAIVDQLELELGSASGGPLVKQGTENLEAYHLLLKARHHMTEFWEPGLLTALECLEQAIELDPDYALAHSVMAECYLIRSNFGNLPGGEAFPRVRSAVRRALELDPELGDARGIHAIYLAWHDLDWPAAEREMELALRYSPQNVWNHLYHAAMLATSRRSDEIVSGYLPALELDPLNPVIHVHSTLFHFYAGLTEKAATDARKSHELFPDYWLIPYFQSFVSWQKRDGAAAVALIEKAVEMTGGNLPYVACYAAAVQFFFGNEQEGERWLSEVERLAAAQFVPPTGRALVEIARGRTRQAIELLEQAHAEHDTPFVWIRALCERLDIIADERIRRTMERLGLP